jgi:cytochrome o ubiquinol oxidase subunit IV
MQSDSPAQGHSPGVATGSDPHHGRSYLIGLGFALVLTAASFWASSTPLVYARALPVLIAVLAVAQMGVHVAALVVFGSLFIMTNLNHNMVSMDQLMQMQR